MPDSISKQLANLPHCSRTELVQIWRELFHTTPHLRIGRRLLVQVIAYRMQEQAYGGLSKRTERRLQQAAQELEDNVQNLTSLSPLAKPGTRLLREWRQEVHAVVIEAKGYSYRDERYTSLSAIARKITGARWSGPRFFGLHARRPQPPTRRSNE